MDEKIKFDDLGLSEETLAGIKRKGFEEPSPIQAKTIPYLLTGEKNVIGQAQTGTGKTAAFGLPLIDKLKTGSRKVQALILAPTRELAVQVCEEINSLKGSKRVQVAPIYGGQSYGEQFRRLKSGIDIVVGTPGRIQDHINKGSLDLSHLSWLILDEADEMLNMGFVEDIEKILESVNEEKRMVLFSATMPPTILKIARKYMGDYEVISVTTGDGSASAGFMTSSAPISLAKSRRRDAISTRMILPAPRVRYTWAKSNPIGPAPTMAMLAPA